jgi:hypothetical protein
MWAGDGLGPARMVDSRRGSILTRPHTGNWVSPCVRSEGYRRPGGCAIRGWRLLEGRLGDPMCHKAINFAVALSFILFLPPRVVSQDINGSNRTWETPTQRGMHRSSKVIGPAVQDDRYALEADTSIAGFKEYREGLSEFKEAQQFIQLKAAVYADLNRLEKSRHAKPRCDTVRGADSNCQSSGNLAVNRANGRSIRESPAQAKSAVLPVSSMSAGGSQALTQSRRSGAYRKPAQRL